LIAQYLALCISGKRKWFGHRTRVKGVLICDRENHEVLIAERLKQMRRGLRMRKKDIPLYYLPRKEGDLLDEKWVKKLVFTIKTYNISLVVFDTLHRYGDYQENNSDDISRLYTKCFSPLIDQLGVTILFLHHTTKIPGKNQRYRGSGDFLGMCDFTYSVKRSGKSEFFTIVNEKGRTGELGEIKGRIHFLDKEILFEKVDVSSSHSVNKLKELTQKVQGYFSDPEKVLKKGEVEELLKKEEYEYSQSTLKRCLNWLVQEEILNKIGERKGYVLNSKEEKNE
jgi:hypothetical protein